MTVAQLLTASREAHTEYRQLAAKHPKPGGWQAYLWDAMTLRVRAHLNDQHHADPAWSADNHEALMLFYRQQLGLQTTDK